MAFVVRGYERSLARAPVSTTGLVAGALGFVGDAVAQRVEPGEGARRLGFSYVLIIFKRFQQLCSFILKGFR